MKDLRAIILAAGKGTRMKSDLPKVLHKVAGKAVIDYVLDCTAFLSSLKTYVVVGHQSEKVRQALGSRATIVLQPKLLGTADAVRCAVPHLRGFRGDVLILCGDTPLLNKSIVKRLIQKHNRTNAACTFLTASIDRPHGYGRIIRDGRRRVVAIREEKDATAGERSIREINVGVYCFRAGELLAHVKGIRINPKKKEFYLTDIVELLLAHGKKVETLGTGDPSVAFGVNTREDLALADDILRRRVLKRLMESGVTIVDPSKVYIEDGAVIGRDTIIYPFTVIHSNVRVGAGCQIGPFARLRPGARIGNRVEIGNFAEISRSSLGEGSFMKHFSFLGDTRAGRRVNIGAGVVTANFDGKEKNKTSIGDDAFIGSDAILVAPVTVGRKAMVGAAAVVTKGRRVPPGAIAVGVPARIYRRRDKA